MSINTNFKPDTTNHSAPTATGPTQSADAPHTDVGHPTCEPEPSLPYEPPPADMPDDYASLQAQDPCDQGYERADFDGPSNTFTVGDCINSEVIHQTADLADNSMAHAFFAQLEAQEPTTLRAVRSELSILDSRGQFSMDEAIELLDNSDAVAHRLQNTLGSPRLADRSMEALENHLVNQVTHRASNRALADLEPHMNHIEQLNASSDSRRTFLAELASSTTSVEQIETALLEFGMSSSEADELAELLLPIQEFPAAEQLFLDGDDGPSRGILRRDAYVKAERMLEKHLDSAGKGFESLQSMIRSDSIDGGAALNNPTLAPYIDAELRDLGVQTDPPDAAAEAFQRVRDDGRAAHNRDAIAKGVISFSAAATLSATGIGSPLAVGLITSTALELPGVADGHTGVHQARASTGAGHTDNPAVDDAFNGRTRSYAAAMGAVAAGTATGQATQAAVEGARAGANQR